MRRRISPAVVLFVLAPAVGELLSGSSPPVEFFNPFTFFLLAALYGGGAILVRELVFKWRMGTRQYCWHEFGWFGRFNRIGVAVATVGAMARQQPRGATERIRS